MVILGLDPGIAIVGYGVIRVEHGQMETVAHGAITTPAHTELSARLEIIHRDLTELIQTYHPDEAVVEELFFNTNITTGITVAEARGVILLTCRLNQLPTYEYTPLQVKQTVVGYGRAEKQQVIAMVQNILKLKVRPKLDDTADALAIAICHAHASGSRIAGYFNR